MKFLNSFDSTGYRQITAIVTVGSVILFSGVRGALLDTGIGNLAEMLIGILLGVILCTIAIALVMAIENLFRRLPKLLLIAFAVAWLVTWFFDENSLAAILRMLFDTQSWSNPLDWPTGLETFSLWIISLALGFVAGTIVLVLKRAVLEHRLWLAATGLSLVATFYVVIELSRAGDNPLESQFSNFQDTQLPEHDLADPSAVGEYSIVSLSYGAGENNRRPEFGEFRDLESRTVDASKILPEWKDFKGAMRERFWGFNLEQAPLNGLVWAPEGEGPFPLALVVHGNHGMEDYSDGGYAYLGELLASRGYIVVSVDQNYINGTWSGDFQGNEMAARAWLLLEHLRLWRDWNNNADHRFGSRVDMDNIALVGHSRGGEAVSIAYAFNSLSNFPDDATVEFNYGFNIKSLVAIAQVDQRYQRRVEIEDVNFLALQGSYDSDEPAFHGLRQYNRIDYSGGDYYFKTGLYIHGANHGQFNTSWGRRDFSPPQSWLLNVQPIIPAEDQQKIAQVYISAFLDATLRADTSYLNLFRDPRIGATWLPDVPYVNQFTDSSFSPLANFEEDISTVSASASGGRISAEGFELWREEELKHRDERLQGTSAVVVGWQSAEGSEDLERAGYTIEVPESYWSESLGEDALLSLAISTSTESVPEVDEDNDSQSESDSSKADNEKAEDENDSEVAPEFVIEALLSDGSIVNVESRNYARLAPPLKVRFLKNESENNARYNSNWEPILQTMDLPLRDLTAGGNYDQIESITFRFNTEQMGVVIMDDIGVRASL